jgi:hypothetical protein
LGCTTSSLLIRSLALQQSSSKMQESQQAINRRPQQGMIVNLCASKAVHSRKEGRRL